MAIGTVSGGSIGFKTDLEILLEQTVPSKERWVNRFRPQILFSAQRVKNDSLHGSQIIYSIFAIKDSNIKRKPCTTIRRSKPVTQKKFETLSLDETSFRNYAATRNRSNSRYKPTTLKKFKTLSLDESFKKQHEKYGNHDTEQRIPDQFPDEWNAPNFQYISDRSEQRIPHRFPDEWNDSN